MLSQPLEHELIGLMEHEQVNVVQIQLGAFQQFLDDTAYAYHKEEGNIAYDMFVGTL